MLSVPTLFVIFSGFPLLIGPNSFTAIQVALLTLTRSLLTLSCLLHKCFPALQRAQAAPPPRCSPFSVLKLLRHLECPSLHSLCLVWNLAKTVCFLCNLNHCCLRSLPSPFPRLDHKICACRKVCMLCSGVCVCFYPCLLGQLHIFGSQ